MKREEVKLCDGYMVAPCNTQVPFHHEFLHIKSISVDYSPCHLDLGTSSKCLTTAYSCNSPYSTVYSPYNQLHITHPDVLKPT